MAFVEERVESGGVIQNSVGAGFVQAIQVSQRSSEGGFVLFIVGFAMVQYGIKETDLSQDPSLE
jgi:hypothetical protein